MAVEKKYKKMMFNASLISIGLLLVTALYFFIFSGEEKRAVTPKEKGNSNVSSDKTWDAFKTSVAKDTGKNFTKNRGLWVDQSLQEDRMREEGERRRKADIERKGQVRLKKSDLTSLLNSGKRKANEESDEYTELPSVAADNRNVPKVKKGKSFSGKRGGKTVVRRERKPRTRKKKDIVGLGSTEAEGNLRTEEEKKTPPNNQTFYAVVHEKQEINAYSQNARITVRFLQPLMVNTCHKKVNQLYPAQIAGLSGSRLLIKVVLLCDNKRYVYNAYDEDGEMGVYINDLSVEGEVGRSIQEDVIAEETNRLGDRLGVGTITRSLNKIVGAKSKKSRYITISSGKKIRFMSSL